MQNINNPTTALLRIEDLVVEFSDNSYLQKTQYQNVCAVQQINFEINYGEVFCLVGESGSGKSVTALAIMRLLDESVKTQGKILFENQNLLELDDDGMREVRGNKIAMIFQEPMTSLNPVLTIGEQIIEAIILHNPQINLQEAIYKTISALEQVQIDNPQNRFYNYPHQLSGGQRQRVMIAMALVCSPKLLIADEPTTAIDVTIQAEILELMRELQRVKKMSILFITHDFGVVAQMANRVGVMQSGKLLEIDEVDKILKNPQHSYSQKLISSLPENLPKPQIHFNKQSTVEKNIIEIKNLRVYYPIKQGLFRRTVDYIRAVDDVNLQIEKGKIIALVGESGCGKTTLGRSLVALEKVTSGKIYFQEQLLTGISQKQWQKFRPQIQMVFQDPHSALNPRIKIVDALIEPLQVHNKNIDYEECLEIAANALAQVQLPRDSLWRYAHAFSGGQRQRINIARSLLLNPKVLICDEITSSLDVSVQAELLFLLQEIRLQQNLTMLFITHNISVVEYLSDKTAVMQNGKIVEFGETAQICGNPQHAYTQKLITAVAKISL